MPGSGTGVTIIPRNGSGTYSQPAGTAAVSNTPITASANNALVQDIGNEITASLPVTGTKAMAANLPMGGFKATGAADPTGAQDYATKAYVDTGDAGVTTALAWKQPVAVATTANIALTGEQTIDGVLTSASRVLVKNQTTPSQNGIYVSAAGAWTRATDMDAWAEVPGAMVWVVGGTTQASTVWGNTSASSGTIGTTAMTWVLDIPAAGAVSKAGDTMTGNLTMAPAAAGIGILLQKKTSGFSNFLNAYTAALLRWQLLFGNATAEGGANSGSDFALNRADDTGAVIDTPLTIPRSTGVAAFLQVPTAAGSVVWTAGNKPGLPAPDVWIRAEFSSGTGGGTFTSGSDQTRPLNTVKRNVLAGVSLSSNQLTVVAGTYFAEWIAAASGVNTHQSLLYNVTDAATIERGEVETAGSGVNVNNSSHGCALFTIAASKVIELRHRGSVTRASDGMGGAGSFGTEVYTDLKIWKVA